MQQQMTFVASMPQADDETLCQMTFSSVRRFFPVRLTNISTMQPQTTLTINEIINEITNEIINEIINEITNDKNE